MDKKRTIKLIHFFSTGWFVLTIGYLFVLALRQAGFNWWLIFSLSGHSVLMVILLLSVYLFAIYRGAVRSQAPQQEHPLSATAPYIILYCASPVLGGLAGVLGVVGNSDIKHFLTVVSIGTLSVTFLMWIVIDPLVGIIELTLPGPRRHRRKRLVRARQLRRQQQLEQERLLSDLEAQETLAIQKRSEQLADDAERLAELLLSAGCPPDPQTQQTATELAIKAWQLGGMDGMRQLRDMALEICQQNSYGRYWADYISVWWDGIGDWRSPSLVSSI